jgi:pimeloyl-ACP methyl ester carboxylesterase
MVQSGRCRCPDRRCAAHPVEVRFQPRGDPYRSVRRIAEQSRQGPVSVLERLRHHVLWRQSSRGESLSGDAGSVLAVEYAGRPQEPLRSVKAFSETDFHEDLKKFDVLTLIMHGEDDQVVPINISGKRSAKLIKGAKEIFYPGSPHGLTATNPDQVNADLLNFVKSVQQTRKAAA